MCLQREVQLETVYLRDYLFELANYNYTVVQQHLTICLASPSIVPEDISPKTLPIYNHIAISVVPITGDERLINIMIFFKTEEQRYIPIDLLTSIKLQPPQDLSTPLILPNTPISQSNQEQVYYILSKNVQIFEHEYVPILVTSIFLFFKHFSYQHAIHLVRT